MEYLLIKNVIFKHIELYLTKCYNWINKVRIW